MPSLAGYELHEKIYDAEYTEVYRGERIDDHKSIICKILKDEYPSVVQVARFRHEFEILNQLKDQSSFASLESYKNKYFIVFEDYGDGTLTEFMSKNVFTLIDKVKIAIQLVDELEKIHQHKIIHKDINPNNIIWSNKDQSIKIIDFSISILLGKEVAQPKNLNVLEGTLAYLSPEQTGRMNRAIDYRCDYYALGVTLYELFSGSLPFQSEDTFELIHSHISKIPKPISEINPNIPVTLSKIVLKLLEKSAENRYQSAHGIKQDLLNCLHQLEKNKNISEFELATADFITDFRVPEKLYGRQTEIKRILTVFNSTCKGNTDLLLIKGSAGVGKSAIIHELYKPIVLNRANFISGKFDELNRNIPYTPFIQAAEEMIRHLMSEDEASLESWRNRILDAVGKNGQLIIDIIPILENIIGPQTKVDEINPVEAQNRFNYTFLKFIKAFSNKESPLVLFIDDLQWADLPSLNFLEKLLTYNINYLLIIGAYRDNEVQTPHPLLLMLEKISKFGKKPLQMSIEPLSPEHVTELIADTLKKSASEVRGLAELTYKKTGGNPFFLIQFLNFLWNEHLIYFNLTESTWKWDEGKILTLKNTDNVVSLMIQKLEKLAHSTQEALKFASCLGGTFDLEMLAKVYNHTPQETAEVLWEALQEGLIAPSDESYKLVYSDNNINPSYYFSHDRIQQAAYSLLKDEEKIPLHLKSGRLLLQNSPNYVTRNIFPIMNHINIGINLVTDKEERINYARLNLEAALKAKESAANTIALNYLETGINFLNADDDWKDHYKLSLSLYSEAAIVSYLCNDFEKSDVFGNEVISHATQFLDRVNIDELRINILAAKHEFQRAKELIISTLEQLGVKLPKKLSTLQLLLQIIKTKLLLFRKSDEDLINLKPMSDPYSIAANNILSTTGVLYFTDPLLCFYSILISLKLGVIYGYDRQTAPTYSGYGILLCAMGEINKAYKFGQIALKTDQVHHSLAAKPIIMNEFFINHWKDPIREMLPRVLDAYPIAMENGNIEMAMSICYGYPGYQYTCGVELETIEKNINKFLPIAERYDHTVAKLYCRLLQQVIFLLKDGDISNHSIDGDYFDAKTTLPKLTANSDLTGLFNYYFNSMYLSFIFNEYDKANKFLFEAKKYLKAVIPLAETYIIEFYEALIITANWQQLTFIEKSKAKFRLFLIKQHFSKWATLNPHDILHKQILIKAEVARIYGFKQSAEQHYDQAIVLAKKNEFPQEAAISSELAGRYYNLNDRPHIAKLYVSDAQYSFTRWGAHTKAKQLIHVYPDFFEEDIQPSKKSQSIHRIIDGRATRISSQVSSEVLDLTTVTKASQAISRELEFDELLKKLMSILIENAGANKGLLLLEENGEWSIKIAVDETNSFVITPTDTDLAPKSIIQYVLNSKEVVEIDDARSPNPFISDPYIEDMQPQSILCMPLLNQGIVKGILYLENSVATGSFTKDRISLLNILSGQIIISIENAKYINRIVKLNQSYDRFVPKQFLNLLDKKSITDVALGDQVQKHMTVLFCDLRNFTTVSETMSPKENFQFINNFFRLMEPAITKHHGFIDKYIGDAIMALFPTSADDAVDCSLEMIAILNAHNQTEINHGKQPIFMGIGLNSGVLMLGMVGSEIRLEGTVISDVVNVAARVEGLTKTYNRPLLITESTFSCLTSPDKYSICKIATTTVKGKLKHLSIYAVKTCMDPEPVETNDHFNGESKTKM